MLRTRGCIYNFAGTTESGVTVTVKKAGTAVNATLYADDGITTKSNGFTNDSDGTFEYYAPNGRYDEVYTKTGVTFTDDNSKDIILFDPRDDAAAVLCQNEFLAPYVTGTDMLVDGKHWVITAGVTRVVGDTTYRNGWIDVLESGGTAGSIALSTNSPALALLWVPTTDVLLLEMRIEKVGDAVAGTRRAGLGSASLTAGDPTNGIYVRQIDAANAFLICRAGGTETTTDLGQTLNNPTRLRVTITTGSVRVYVDDVAKTPATTNIPTTIMGLSAGGGATASAAGLRLDYLNVLSGVRV
jgi:hypothetical protein